MIILESREGISAAHEKVSGTGDVLKYWFLRWPGNRGSRVGKGNF